ncbi:MAG: hypothetical protein FJX23_02485 [Alphaproteobacteria bacterium]|nr:hypothetical protein [Alphaproteobacteria bacterium]
MTHSPKHLFVYRHADTLPATGSQTDHARVLSEQGEDECRRVGTFLKTNNIHPDVVLCSTANRTRSTLALTQEALGREYPTRFEDGLYLASAWDVLHFLNELDDSVGTAMVIAHNPGLHHLCQLIAKHGDPEGQEAINTRFPPATLALIKLDIQSWKDLAPVTDGELLGVAMPK